MPRTAKGSIFVSSNVVNARVVVAPKKYVSSSLHGIVEATDEATARAWAGTLQELVDALRALGRSADIGDALDTAIRVGLADGAVDGLARVRKSLGKLRGDVDAKQLEARTVAKPGAMTFKRFAERWTSGELHKEFPDHAKVKRSARGDVSRLGTWVYPVLGHLPISEVTLDAALEVMRRIPSERSGATRRHVAQAMSRVLKLAVFPCRVIHTNPLPPGFLPKVGPTKALTYLYPDEDAKLLACKGVPLAARMLWGVLAREGLRASEALSLTWGDLDLVRGSIKLDENKTDDVRAWALDAGVCSALKAWRKLQGKGNVPATAHVFTEVENEDRLAEVLRRHLRDAKVTRKELFERSKARRPIRAHDLRATFITVNLANGKTETWIADRTGHRSSGQIMGYKRAARTLAELHQGELTPLDAAIPELR